MDLEDWLQTKVLVNKFVYLDYWSVVHFITGYLLWSLLKLDLIIAFALIVGYELIEPLLPFRPETRLDKIWDVIIGALGYYIARGGL